jgi:hypothetical protein
MLVVGVVLLLLSVGVLVRTVVSGAHHDEPRLRSTPPAAPEPVDEDVVPVEDAVDEWTRRGFDALAASRWTSAGFEAEHAYLLRSLEVDAPTAHLLRDAGLDEDTVVQLVEDALLGGGRRALDDLVSLSEYLAVGFRLAGARAWRDAGFAPEEARAWKREHFGWKQAVEWKRLGDGPAQARTVAAAFTAAHVAVADGLRWLDRGYTIEEICAGRHREPDRAPRPRRARLEVAFALVPVARDELLAAAGQLVGAGGDPAVVRRLQAAAAARRMEVEPDLVRATVAELHRLTDSGVIGAPNAARVLAARLERALNATTLVTGSGASASTTTQTHV